MAAGDSKPIGAHSAGCEASERRAEHIWERGSALMRRWHRWLGWLWTCSLPMPVRRSCCGAGFLPRRIPPAPLRHRSRDDPRSKY
eukprot:6192796-Pleurochrysis_carterae.AAC.4